VSDKLGQTLCRQNIESTNEDVGQTFDQSIESAKHDVGQKHFFGQMFIGQKFFDQTIDK
jgi:hypothetical protein